ncbi:Endo-1,3(4)-beta-glucanase-like protein 1 [Phlyctema vagabunda]|uniref:Endo-1,3(4)-beta-glucanase-like protein 1 n=1 Tax=Phlyctema vagabunda TaxID=108571 RepID=A0ABR4PSW8_9HELO
MSSSSSFSPSTKRRSSAILLLGLAHALLSEHVQAQAPGSQLQYSLVHEYSGSSFLDNFDFVTTHPFPFPLPSYLSRQECEELDIAFTSSTDASTILSIDQTNNVDVDGPGRGSIRIESRDSFTLGLVVSDIMDMPGGICGVWAGHKSFGTGTINIVEGVNTQSNNLMSLHTADTCTIDQSPSSSSGTLSSPNCDSTPEGCSVLDASALSYGTEFNDNGGGIYATEWTASLVRIWFFARGTATPADLSTPNPQPDPQTWGPPHAVFDTGDTGDSCDLDENLASHRVAFDTSFCGPWADQMWSQLDECAGLAPTCEEYVANPNDGFPYVRWKINSVKIYQLPEQPGTSGNSPGQLSALPSSALASSSVIQSSPASSSVALPSPPAQSTAAASSIAALSSNSASPFFISISANTSSFSSVAAISSSVVVTTRSVIQSSVTESALPSSTISSLTATPSLVRSSTIASVVLPSASVAQSSAAASSAIRSAVRSSSLNFVSSNATLSSTRSTATQSSTIISTILSSAVVSNTVQGSASILAISSASAAASNGLQSSATQPGVFPSTGFNTTMTTNSAPASRLSIELPITTRLMSLSADNTLSALSAISSAAQSLRSNTTMLSSSAFPTSSQTQRTASSASDSFSSRFSSVNSTSRATATILSVIPSSASGSSTLASITAAQSSIVTLSIAQSSDIRSVASASANATMSPGFASGSSRLSSGLRSPTVLSSTLATGLASQSSTASPTASGFLTVVLPSGVVASSATSTAIQSSGRSPSDPVQPTSVASTAASISLNSSSTISQSFSSQISNTRSSSTASFVSTGQSSTIGSSPIASSFGAQSSGATSIASSPTGPRASSTSVSVVATPSTLPTEFRTSAGTYFVQGCYADPNTDGGPLNHPDEVTYTRNNTASSSVTSCLTACGAGSYLFAGYEIGFCFCSNTLDDAPQVPCGIGFTRKRQAVQTVVVYALQLPSDSATLSPSVLSTGSAIVDASVTSAASQSTTATSDPSVSSSSSDGFPVTGSPFPLSSAVSANSASGSTSTDSGPGPVVTPNSSSGSADLSTSSTASTSTPPSQTASLDPITTPAMTTSTVYTTTAYTITSCAATVTDCPARLGQVTTETIALYTTVCPVAEAPTLPTAAAVPAGYTASTVYTTTIYTITSCTPSVTDCPARMGSITTEVVLAYTTICPISPALTTVVYATYVDVCPTGLTTLTATRTLTLALEPTALVTMAMVTTVKIATIAESTTTVTCTIPALEPTPAAVMGLPPIVTKVLNLSVAATNDASSAGADVIVSGDTAKASTVAENSISISDNSPLDLNSAATNEMENPTTDMGAASTVTSTPTSPSSNATLDISQTSADAASPEFTGTAPSMQRHLAVLIVALLSALVLL